MYYVIRVLVFVLMVCYGAFSQPAGPIVLIVDVDNAVQYRSDIADPARRGADAGSTTAAAPRAFTDTLFIGDIVAINGKPAKGVWTSRQYHMNYNPSPAVGFAISDVSRGYIAECKWEFMDMDGRFIGALADSGLFPHAVVGGLGAYYGIRGQMGAPTPANPNARPIRVASMSEDPANRRSLGGGTSRVAFHLIPMERPVVEGVLHADMSPVTPADPVRPGETLIVRATGLGPLVPGTTPPGAEPFPNPPVEVNSPVEATINGLPAAVISKIGWPRETTVYRVDLRVPDGLTGGEAVLQLTAAWIPGSPYRVPVR